MKHLSIAAFLVLAACGSSEDAGSNNSSSPETAGAAIEQTPANLLAWTDGQALVATGSPFGPVDLNGKTYRIGQANNALMFPGLGLGTIVCRASVMSEPLFLAAARAI